LAVAVFVVEIASVQHGFWIVLATLSVLRPRPRDWLDLPGAQWNRRRDRCRRGCCSTQSGAMRQSRGRLPVAVLVAAYGSRALPFAAGQASFTVTVLVIVNIILPTGWQLGLLRVEDVAIGSAISLAVGLLF
jgi:uncharacterized membrane protein YccC